MDNSLTKGIRSALGAISFAVAFVGLGVSLSGCPVAAPLENEGRFDQLNQSGGTGNVGGSGSLPCDQELPDGPGTPDIACDYPAFMRAHCARSGCHNAATHSASLDLTLDPFLIARILEVPAKHEITCTGGLGRCDLMNPQCAECMMCPSGPTDLILSKTDPANSWIMVKMDRFNVDTPTTAPPIGCGTAMPYPPGGTGFTNERRDCLKRFFTWVANNGRACSVAAGGMGGGGAGGAGTAGAGSGGGGAGGT